MQKFSVLISVYFREKSEYLVEALNSIFTQTVMPDQVVLVKDGPLPQELDNLIEEFVKKYDTIKVLALPENVGLGNALNAGLKECTYELIARMDTDDIAKADRFEKQIEIFNNNPDLDVVGAWVDEFEKDVSNVLSTRKLPELHADIYAFAKSRCPINHPVVMFRKQAIVEVGGYQHFPLFEDYFLWVRLLKNGAKFYNIQESLLFFRFSPDMFKRRGGWKYATDEFRFQNVIRKMKFISFGDFLKNVSIRFVVRIVPNSLRTLVYKKILRK